MALESESKSTFSDIVELPCFYIRIKLLNTNLIVHVYASHKYAGHMMIWEGGAGVCCVSKVLTMRKGRHTAYKRIRDMSRGEPSRDKDK